MNKTTTRRTATKAAPKKAAPKKTTNRKANVASVAPHVYITPYGAYRARICINGQCYSKNFSSLSKAKTWIKSL